MTDLVFITKSKLFDRDIHGTISRTFFARTVSGEALERADSETVLWIVVKGNVEYYIQSRLKIDLIQRYTQGRMSGLYVISCSKSFGGHIYSPSDLQLSIDTSFGFEKSPQFDSIDIASVALENLLQSKYNTTLRRTNLRLNNDNRRRLLMSYAEKNINELSSLSIDQIELELRDNFYESELFLIASLPSIDDPYLSTAIEIFSIINDVPLTSLSSVPELFKFSNNKQTARKYFTDCVLRSLTEDDVIAREMIWNPDNFGEDKFKAGLLKTNLAEYRHQEILRQLIRQFLSKGFVPLGSSSIDLAIKSNDDIIIFEIKSSTLENYKDQAFKGCNQLNEYAFNLATKYKKNISKFLILEVPIGGEINGKYVAEICKLMGVVTVDFDFRKEWPDRCLIPI